MIPSDLAARLKLLIESVVQPLTPVTAVQRDLPAFERGQRFSAQVQSPLPDGTFRAVVAGRTVTLSLPESAKAGDTLELVVVDRTPKVIVAALAPPTAERQPAGTATLSSAAQLISRLLKGSADAPPPTALSRGQPLLETPPHQPAFLASQLKRALIESGAFYESHQARWVSGELPLSALLAEPQGRESPLLRLPAEVVARLVQQLSTGTPLPALPEAAGNAGANGEPHVPPATGLPPEADGAPAQRRQLTPEARLLAAALGVELPDAEQPSRLAATAQEPDAETGAERSATPPAKSSPAALPKELAGIVQQQLEALATHHLVWQGQLWPGQTATWEIEEPLRERESAASEDDAPVWRTTLRMSLPRLGPVTATLSLDRRGVALGLTVRDATSGGEFEGRQAELSAALGAAGVPLLALAVEHGPS